jgi:hypothetical protein
MVNRVSSFKKERASDDVKSVEPDTSSKHDFGLKTKLVNPENTTKNTNSNKQ